MKQLSFSIKNYHAIGSANINLNGITVIAGENGCGKSTISRWMYYVANGINDYENLERDRLVDFLSHSIRSIVQILHPGSDIRQKYRDFVYQRNGIFESNLSIEEVHDKYQLIINSIKEDILRMVMAEPKSRVVNRLLMELGVDTSEGVPCIINNINDYFAKIIGRSEIEFEGYHSNMNDRKMTTLFVRLMEKYGIDDSLPDNMSFYEDDYRIIQNNHFTDLMPIRQAIYVDTAMAFLNNPYSRENNADQLRFLLNNPSQKSSIPIENRKAIVSKIAYTINGDIVLKQEDFMPPTLQYKRHDGLVIPIDKAATGIKSFAILYRLIENGHLDSETLLMIDEPESHLHPQWVVEYARMLVMIHKTFGTRIVIASHDPDMVLAIQTIANKQEVLDNTTFYIAKLMPESNQYQFVNTGSSVEDIFESFNLSILRIEDYGKELTD